MDTSLTSSKVFDRVKHSNTNQYGDPYDLSFLFEAFVKIFGISSATQIIIGSDNKEWAFQFAGQYNEKQELTTDLREKLAQAILESEDEYLAYRFFRCIRQVKSETREKLINASFVKDQREKESLLKEPAIGF